MKKKLGWVVSLAVSLVLLILIGGRVYGTVGDMGDPVVSVSSLPAGTILNEDIAGSLDGQNVSDYIPGDYKSSYTIDESLFELVSCSYYYDNLLITYNKNGFSGQVDDDGKPCYFSVYYDGGETKFNYFSGSPATYYYHEEPFVEKDADGNLKYGVLANEIHADTNSNIEYVFDYIEDGYGNYYLIKDLRYRPGMGGSIYTIDTANINSDGVVSYNGNYDSQTGFYQRTVNSNYRFSYKGDANSFVVQVTRLPSDINIILNSEIKSHAVNVEGEDDIVSSDKESYNYFETAEIVIAPDDGYILNEAVIKSGSTTIMTLYGGMQTEGSFLFASNSYNSLPKLAYGSFAFAYSASGSYESHTSAQNNNAYIEISSKSGDDDYFVISLDDSGIITIKKSKVSKAISIEVSTQQYLQINLKKDNDLSTVPFKSVTFNGNVYTANLTSKLFMVGNIQNVDLRVELNIGHGFDLSMDPLYIKEDGSVYERTLTEGGVYEIVANVDDACTLLITLVSDGDYFKDARTKIYISTRDISSKEDFLATELSTNSTGGSGTKKNIAPGTTVKIYIQISPYYMMTDLESGNSYAYEFIDLEYKMNSSKTISFNVEKIAFNKDVYQGETKLGTMHLELNGINNAQGEAIYYVSFAPEGSQNFADVKKDNPKVIGYDLVNFVCGGKELLTYYIAGSVFRIDAADAAIHMVIAEEVFYAEKIEATFEIKLVEFKIQVYEDYLDGMAYYETKEIYVKPDFQITQPGKCFGGITYDDGQGNGFIEHARDFDVDPVLIEEGIFAGYYKYTLVDAMVYDEYALVFGIVLANIRYDVKIYYYHEDATMDIVEAEVEYSTTFKTEDLNTEGFEIPSYEGKYNFIGWAVSENEEEFYILADESEFEIDEEIVYEWLTNIRLVPVFSAEIIKLYLHDGHSVFKTVDIKYEQELDIDDFLKDGEDYITMQTTGYQFMGFFNQQTGGTLVVKYNPNDVPVYTVLHQDNTAIFTELPDGTVLWTPQDTVVLYAQWEALECNIILRSTNTQYQTGPIAANVGSLGSGIGGSVVLTGFIITDTIMFTGLHPTAYGYISRIDIKGESMLIGTCSPSGELDTPLDEGVYDAAARTLIIKVSDFITEITDGTTIEIEVQYEPITYLVTFHSGLYNQDGDSIAPCDATSVYFLVKAEDNTIDKVDNWISCDASGSQLGATGWTDLTISPYGLTLSEVTLNGIAGISFTAPNGKSYSFKRWRDPDKNADLTSRFRINSSFEFFATFSNIYDVTLSYYVWSDVLGEYLQNSYSGYFWNYNAVSETYYIDNAKTANSYEVFPIDGKLYYIYAWTESVDSDMIIYDEDETYVSLNSMLSFAYSTEMQARLYYAVYREFEFSSTIGPNSCSVTMSVPNDANGNTYSTDDIRWVKISMTAYMTYRDGEISLEDYLAENTPNTIHMGSSVITFEQCSSMLEGEYLICMISRRIAGQASPKYVYAAIIVGHYASGKIV